MRPSHFVGVSSVCLLMLAGSLSLAGAASAAPAGVTLAGVAPATAHEPGTVRFTYTVDVAGADIDATVFTTHQDVELPVAVSTAAVTLDGVAVPAGQITQTVVGDIAVQVGANPADGLTMGAHTLAFNATVGTTTASTSSTASMAWTDASVPGTTTSPPVAVAVNQIDIATTLTPDFGEEQVGFLGTGNDAYFAIDVSNIGYGAPDIQLVIDLDPGLALGPDGVSRDEDDSVLPCAPALGNPQQLVCDVGPLAHLTAYADPTLEIDLIPTADAVVGHIAAVTATSSPQPGQGTDANAANDSVTAHLQFTGAAALTSTITPAQTNVHLGGSTTVKLTVHNAGPQPTGQTIAFSVVAGDNFTITAFSGNTKPPPELGGQQDQGLTTDDSGDQVVLWFAGDIAAGHSATATLTLKAVKLGSSRIDLFTSSEAGDPNCTEFNCDPTAVTMRVIAAVPAVVTPPTTAPTTAAGLTLASTGSASGPQVGIAALLLLTGVLLLSIGARRRICGGLPPL
jgi:hypothetical protein